MLFEAIAGVRELYEAPGRHYHGWGHVEDCLAKALRLDCTSRVLLALLYHDAIYVPGAKDNEERSADLFRTHSSAIGGWSDQVPGLILATKHDRPPRSPEEALVVDIDMSGLGESWETFQHNDANIRAEFSAFTDDQWIAGRAAFLRSLLAKDRIFYSVAFADHETPARANIERKIAELTARPSHPGNPR